MVDKGKGRRRGPLTDKSEVLTTRITEETRRALEASADKAGRSISQQAEMLLVRGLNGSDSSLRHLDAVLETVATVARRLSMAEGGAGARDSTFVYYGVIKALEWACDTLPVPREDGRFSDVAALDDAIERVREARDKYKMGRRLDVRTDEERAANSPSDEMEQLDRELIALLARRQAGIAAIKNVHAHADQAVRDMIAETTT